MLDDRKKAFETKFVIDEELEFKAKAMASKLFGNWASETMSMKPSETDNYVKHLIELSIHNKDYSEVIQYVQNNLKNIGIDYNKQALEDIFLEKLRICRDKLEN